MKKTIYLLNINNYAPEIREITMPFIKKWAEKIRAEIVEIKDRKYADMPVTYEKLQIKDIAKERGDDWIIYIDSDTLIHPDLFDITEHLSPDTVLQHGKDFANNRWVFNDYFRRDGRNIGACNWFTVASKLCLDLWQPLEIPLNEAIKDIYPVQIENNFGITAEHLIDDYVLSLNVAKYGLKYTTFTDLLVKLGLVGQTYFYHQHLCTEAEKVELLNKTIEQWKLWSSKN